LKRAHVSLFREHVPLYRVGEIKKRVPISLFREHVPLEREGKTDLDERESLHVVQAHVEAAEGRLRQVIGIMLDHHIVKLYD